MLGFLTLLTESTITISEHYCSNSSNYTMNSAYEASLNLLLESLPSHTNSSNGFFNTNTSTGDPSDADTVYGRFLCRGDVPKEVCMECVKAATVSIKEKCPMVKASILWYDEFEKKRHSSSRLIIGITSATLAVVLLCVPLWFALKRDRNKRNNVDEDPIGEKWGKLHHKS
ncbi:hypothetical protein NL676_013100 [Syzygium grande]|nr:hypothetical protein NL676_013100 [Syzygium grande]